MHISVSLTLQPYYFSNIFKKEMSLNCTSFCCTYTGNWNDSEKLAWPLRNDDTQICEAFDICILLISAIIGMFCNGFSQEFTLKMSNFKHRKSTVTLHLSAWTETSNLCSLLALWQYCQLGGKWDIPLSLYAGKMPLSTKFH